MMLATNLLGCLLAFAAPTSDSTTAGGEPVKIGGQEYKKMGSREETLTRMLDLLAPDIGHFGKWYLLTPFPYAGHEQNDLARRLEPETELRKCIANGPGPDLKKVYKGKRDFECHWEPIDVHPNEKFDLRRTDQRWRNDNSVCYVYTTIDCDSDRQAPITMGSDDGVRFWLNGKLIHDLDVPRGLDPTQDKLTLDLKKGVNHLMLKISNGAVSWEFQINTRRDLPTDLDAQLFYQLDSDFPPSREREHYRVATIPTPQGVVLEVGGLAIYKDGRPLVATRRGDVYLVDHAFDATPWQAKFKLFATGLHEPLGLATRQDKDAFAAYTVQRGELTRLVDRDGDDVADDYETICDSWGVSGNYHEFAFGPAFDPKDGSALVTLNVGFCNSLGKSIVPWRGWCVRIDAQGNLTPICDGMRSPNGFTFFTDGTPFYVDNQGDYVATNKLAALEPGVWHGHPASLRWHTDLQGDDRPPRQVPAVWFPYKKMGQSVADVELCEQNGKFGPYDGQLFCGDQLAAIVMRVFLEKVDGHHQGACFPFLDGFGCGVNRLEFARDGSLLVGETDRGWTSVGRRREGLERVVFTGKTPFEMLAMRAQKDGFELEFTADVDAVSAADPASYSFISYTYPYHSDYGAPETDTQTLTVASATVVDARHVKLVVTPLKRDYVHELVAKGVKSKTGETLLHDRAYYTLTNIPGMDNRRDDKNLPRALLLTQAVGKEHDAVKRPQAATLSRAEIQVGEAVRGKVKLSVTKDVSQLTAEKLKSIEALVLFTGGDLPLDDAGRARLVEWVGNGGGLTLIHTALDTWPNDAFFGDLIGARLDATGEPEPWVGNLVLDVLDPHHPATAMLGGKLEVEDRLPRVTFQKNAIVHPLLAVAKGSLDPKLPQPTSPLTPVAWWREFGRGRVFVTTLGHTDDVWKNDLFLKHLAAGIAWTANGPDLPAATSFLGDGVVAPFASNPPAIHFAKDDAKSRSVPLTDGVWTAEGGDIATTESFGDATIHVEFATPERQGVVPDDQRGNSGIYIQGRYEIQILDSFGSAPTQTSCGAIYETRAAAVDAVREPARWQSYDIEFTAPRFDPTGKKIANARVTCYLNGKKIHDGVEIAGPTGAARGEPEVASAPLVLQDHGQKVRFRNLLVVKR